MSQNVHDRAHPNTNAVLRLRVDKFDLMTRVLGCESDAARAALLGLTYRTVLRARRGVVGEVFVAQTIFALQREGETLGQYGLKPTLDELFEVVAVERERVAA